MAEMIYNDAALNAAAFSQRWTALTRFDTDIEMMKTWDRGLRRDKRVLVPIDVQAFLAPKGAIEPTVPVAGMRDDPEPFANPTQRAPGVHLHWAMPDALLRGRHVDGATSPTMPALPDRWVVIRTMLPEGGRLVHVKGWVLDAAKGSVTALHEYVGATADAPDGTPTYEPLDGASGGTLMWTATYQGARHRFALHDDLGDLDQLKPVAPNGFHGGRATYTVAGWWSDAADDPLSSSRSGPALRSKVNSFGWHISPESPDDADESIDPLHLKLQERAGFTSPTAVTPTYQVTKYDTVRSKYADVGPASDRPVEAAAAHYVGISQTRYLSLFHGSVLGVPVTATAAGPADDRPPADSITTSVGLDLDDVTAALAAPGFGTSGAQRDSAERLMAAFTSDLLSRIDTADGVRDIEEREHADEFWSFAGPPVPAARDDRLRAEDSVEFGPLAVGRKGRGALANASRGKADIGLQAELAWSRKNVAMYSGSTAGQAKSQPKAAPTTARSGATPTRDSRTVTKPGPRMFRPAPPIIALRGIRPNARHHGDGMYDDEGLRCRWPDECKPGFGTVVNAAAIVPTLGNGAIPGEVLIVVREAATLDPYAYQWLARAGKPENVWAASEARVRAEHLRLYGNDVVYDASGVTGLLRAIGASGPQAAGDSAWDGVSVDATHNGLTFIQEMAKYAMATGAPPSPVALTPWRQPWVPLYVEWRVRVTGRDTLEGWELTGLDFDEANDAPADNVDVELTGRSPLTTGIGKSLSTAMTTWLDAENARDAAIPSQSQLSESGEAALAKLRDLIRPLDLTSCSLDGIREQLLGIEYLGGAVVREAPAPGEKPRPTASGLPTPLFGGQIEVLELRAIDAFGRVLDLPVTTMRTTRRLEVDDHPAKITVRPRIQHGARWLFRLIDPGYDTAAHPLLAPEAYVDQLAGDNAVTPISGYLLPDHMDESLEVFDRFGTPMGELIHDSVSDAVRWEPAPGRPVPPDAGPLTGVPGEFAAHARHAALLALGLIRADVDTRHSDAPAARSALSALLRTIDSTLWSVDTFQSIGSPTIAGLVGRPVAIVRATLRLDVADDIDDVTVTEPGGVDARRAAFAALSTQRFPFRLGDIGRSDDSVLGFYVDDDYTKFHVVDKVVAAKARDSGRHRGHLGLLGDVDVPATDPIVHPFLELEDTLHVLPGQVMRLTILMLPAGKAHLTSGFLPRKALALADDWVTRGLSKMVPSVRIGPVLVDPAEIRLPKVASLGEDQHFIRRTGPLTWRDDPIIAANSAALLPRMPHEAQEGWIRVKPIDPEDQA